MPIVVLVIEDSQTAFVYLRKLLSETPEGNAITLEHANSLEAGLRRLKAGGIDVILLDLLLPDSRGFGAFSSVHTQSPQVPVIMLSGIDDKVVASKMVQDGAFAYLVKGEVTGDSLAGVIRRAFEYAQGSGKHSVGD